MEEKGRVGKGLCCFIVDVNVILPFLLFFNVLKTFIARTHTHTHTTYFSVKNYVCAAYLSKYLAGLFEV